MDPDKSTESSESSGRIEFESPKGFTLPSSAEPGKPFDVVCSFEVKDDGKTLTLCKIGDSDAPGYGSNKADDKPEAKPDYKPMASGMVDSMNSAGVESTGY